MLDGRNGRDGSVELLRVEPDDHAGIGYAVTKCPADKLASAMDLQRWLSGLSSPDRLMLALRQAGHTLAEIGVEIGASTSSVFSRLKELGLELEAQIRSAP